MQNIFFLLLHINLLTNKTVALVDNNIARFHYDFTLGRDRRITLHITHNSDKPKYNKLAQLKAFIAKWCIMLMIELRAFQ